MRNFKKNVYAASAVRLADRKHNTVSMIICLIKEEFTFLYGDDDGFNKEFQALNETYDIALKYDKKLEKERKPTIPDIVIATTVLATTSWMKK